MISIAALRALVAAGASAAMIVDAIEAEMAGTEKKLEARRAKDAARQRNKRASATVTRSHAESNGPETVTLPDSALSSSSPPEIQKEGKKEGAKRDRGHVCPDDFRPAEVHFAAGQRVNISRPRVEACCEAMKSWSKSNAHRAVARKSDWHAALFGWIDRESERTSGKPNGTNGHGRTVLEAADNLIDTLRGFDQPAPGDLLGPARPPYARLLPKG